VTPIPDKRSLFLRFSAPGEVLALCDRLYAVKPPAFIVSVTGECFDHGEKLSPATKKALPRIEAKVAELIRDGHGLAPD
jgi:hypothetical protein